MGFLSGLFKRAEPTRLELIRDVTNMMVEDQAKPDAFFRCFGDVPLAEGQALHSALAEWHALTVSITHYALVSSLDGAVEKISPFMNVYRLAFAERLSPDCRNIFLALVDSREKEYLTKIYDTFKRMDAPLGIKLYGSMARRITGHFDAELEKSNHAINRGPDIIMISAFSGLIIRRLVAAKKFVDGLQEETPRLFSGPM